MFTYIILNIKLRLKVDIMNHLVSFFYNVKFLWNTLVTSKVFIYNFEERLDVVLDAHVSASFMQDSS